MKSILSVAALFGLFAAVAVADSAPKLEGIKCVVSGQPASAEHSAKHLEGKVFFCCPNCPKGFAANPEKFTEKANQQLVLTQQYTAKACPLSGRPIAEKAGAKDEIGFCCKNCLGKYNAASDEDKLKMVYGKAAFEKGFEKKAEKAPAK